MKVSIFNTCAVACKNKPQSTTSNNYNRAHFSETSNEPTSSVPKSETNEGGISKKMIHEFVDFSGGMLGI